MRGDETDWGISCWTVPFISLWLHWVHVWFYTEEPFNNAKTKVWVATLLKNYMNKTFKFVAVWNFAKTDPYEILEMWLVNKSNADTLRA